MGSVANPVHREPWSKGKIVGQKAPFKLKDIWALRVRLQMEERVRELALFNLGIDSKLRGCDLVSLKVRNICHGDQVEFRAMAMQHKTQRPVQFEITAATRDAVHPCPTHAASRGRSRFSTSCSHSCEAWPPFAMAAVASPLNITMRCTSSAGPRGLGMLARWVSDRYRRAYSGPDVQVP